MKNEKIRHDSKRIQRGFVMAVRRSFETYVSNSLHRLITTHVQVLASLFANNIYCMGLAQSIGRTPAMDRIAEQGRGSRTWQFADGDLVASVNSRFAVNMCFNNKTGHVVEALW